jgi:hypothetical protein
VNAVGGATTFAVFVVVSVSKFRLGAWQVMILIPFLAEVLRRIRKHFLRVEEDLSGEDPDPPMVKDRVVMVLTQAGGATKALALARTISPRDLEVIALGTDEEWITQFRNHWSDLGIKVPVRAVGRNVRRLKSDALGTSGDSVTIVLPEPQHSGKFCQLANLPALRVKKAFLSSLNTAVMSVPFPPGQPEGALKTPGRLTLVVFVSSVNRASIRAMEYADSLHPSSLAAMSIQTRPG